MPIIKLHATFGNGLYSLGKPLLNPPAAHYHGSAPTQTYRPGKLSEFMPVLNWCGFMPIIQNATWSKVIILMLYGNIFPRLFFFTFSLTHWDQKCIRIKITEIIPFWCFLKPCGTWMYVTDTTPCICPRYQSVDDPTFLLFTSFYNRWRIKSSTNL